MGDYDVLVVGGTGVDTIVRVDTLAVPPGDAVGVPPIIDYVGHSGNGVALGFHALGLRTKFVDFVGDDAQGRLVLGRYAALGLDFAHLPAPNGTPRSVNLVDAQGRRFSFYDGRHPVDLHMPPEFYLPFLEASRHVHIARAYHPGTVFDDAERLRRSVSTDLHAWDGLDPWARPYAFRSDLVFMSAAAAGDGVEDVMRLIVEQGRAAVVVATEGAAGCRVLARADGVVRAFPAVAPERPVVDSNGAGDAFSTAFTRSWLAGADLGECVLAGAASGAYACTRAGTHEDLIDAHTLDTIRTRLRPDYPATRPSATTETV
ncbi:ribokinase [Microtetraspora sp. NBRC 13810]|uniref:carbohydrate kinase family protein n=1 Tax=Microtetraspora sp. NBRC 13810 TaxID=3030990 RepID=UPI0024A34B21|nr:carbohydrate kinase family protein [Microtetraspora sp. NBRC 13810]GLW09244.1 ribokinase [Microtetraspora sp. NBRC 13810]